MCPLSVRVSRPLAASQTFSVVSQLPETIRLPSGLKATLQIPPGCPWSVRVSWPVAASQTFSVLSALPRDDPLAVRAEGHAANAIGMALEREGFVAADGVPDLQRIVVAADAIRLPSGLKATLKIRRRVP